MLQKELGLFSSVIFHAGLIFLKGMLENGCCVASTVPRLHQALQIDETFDIGTVSNQANSRVDIERRDANFPRQLQAIRRDAIKVAFGKATKSRTRWKRRVTPSLEDREENQNQSSFSKYGIVVMLGESVRNPNRSIDSVLKELKNAFAHVLNWSVSDIHVEKINFRGNIIELSFLQSENFGNTAFKWRVPAQDILSFPGLLEKLQEDLPGLSIRHVTHDNGIILAVYDAPFWMQPYFPYVVAGGCIFIIFIIGIMFFVCFSHYTKASLEHEDKLDGFRGKLHYQTQQQVLFPAVAPDTCPPLAVQPCSAPLFVPVGFATAHVPAQPMRIRGKGLLERRGSNASLTLDLNPSPEMGRWDGTPPKESTALEYLMSAGNRLSRRDLRNAVKNTKILYEEFWEIPMNHPEKVTVAGSGTKNRYKTIIPNEHSRVILPNTDDDPLSSYINANFIRGYEGEQKAYIATQGPMAHTIVDFWNMVWSQGCPIIVMITKLKEKNKPKCENYLPDHRGLYGDVEVTIVKIIQKKGYVVRHIQMKCRGETRLLLHYWYTTWPDHKPPDSPSMLLELVNEVELRRFKQDSVTPQGPVVVHCSAGIGRTGCFVAISIGIRQLREEHSVDILGIVCCMRQDRGGMIQTHEQYDFVHQALSEYEHTLGEPSIQSLTALTSE
ncbi:receptor-type tyrosine-protein phosphatase R-like isoform X2 [Pomacea canaliculata]|nr:receptor-type tyrosine-protein phosphatase R-like isoform X2 [Pomacea canaliculata]